MSRPLTGSMPSQWLDEIPPNRPYGKFVSMLIRS